MLPERDLNALHDMLSHAREAVAAAASRRREDLDTDRFLYLGLQRLAEIIGEAAARVSAPTREQLPEVPWRRAVGMRNRLIHGYDVVEPGVLWDTITLDLPVLVEQLMAVPGLQPLSETEEEGLGERQHGIPETPRQG